jgi:threonylcarbamoyladenosine tRNA methylthiotransferase MtaB
VVTGCAAQVDTGAFENLTGADLVVANSHKGLLPSLIDQHFKNPNQQKVYKSNIFKKEDLEAGGGEELQHTRSFLKIQDGCNSFCSFCIIPYARGKSRSIPINQLVLKINELEKKGIQEVVLTGVHIGDYEDMALNGQVKTFEDLIEAVLMKTKIPRIRLSSLEPIELTDKLLELYRNDRLCPHFHMSIQSADTDVLVQMKRKYSEFDVRASLNKIQNQMQNQMQNAYVGMDVIAGFPTESDEQFENTYKVLTETPWTRLHVFPYSERQGTRAATLPQISMMKRKERGRRLRELSLHRLQMEASKQIGTVKRVLVLNKWNPTSQGLSRDYWNINMNLAEEEHALYKNSEVLIKIESFILNDSDVILMGKRASDG